MTNGAIEWEHWRQFDPRTKDAWKQLFRDHGFEPNTVGFPVVIEGGTMVIRQYLLNEAGHKYLTADREPAHRVVEVELQAEVGLPAICRA
jgi:hypothetical protein